MNDFLVLQGYLLRKDIHVDPRGIEPLSPPCHGDILPVYYGPSFFWNNLLYSTICCLNLVILNLWNNMQFPDR